MKTFAITAAFAVFATGALAANCSPGLAYCTASLLQKGDYASQINQALANAGQTDPSVSNKALFACQGGSNGNIVFTETCKSGCQNGGKGQDDYCNA